MLKNSMSLGVAATVCLALLGGCATPPPTHTVRTDLGSPLTLRYFNYSSDEFFRIKSVEAVSYTAQNISAGVMWLQIGDDKAASFLRLDEAEVIDATGSDTVIKTKDGRKLATRIRRMLVCAPGSTPATPTDCPDVRQLTGTVLDPRNGYRDGGNKTIARMDIYSYAGGNKYFRNIYSADQWAAFMETEAQRAIAAEKGREQDALRRQAAAAERAAQRKVESDARVVRLRGYAAGMTVNCSSNGLLPRGTPAAGGVEFNCATLGRVSIQELQAAGWQTTVIARLPTQYGDVSGDSVEMNATKGK